MPRKNRIKRRIEESLTPEQKSDLIAGPGYHPGPAPFRNEAERRTAWEAHRDLLIRLAISAEPLGPLCAKGKGPGTRPAAWWQFEAPEKRRWAVARMVGRMDIEQDGVEVIPEPSEWPRDLPPGRTLARETEPGFLRRTGLLTDEEVNHFNSDGWPLTWEPIFRATFPRK